MEFCTLSRSRSLSLSLLCSGARRMGRPHPPLSRAAPSRLSLSLSSSPGHEGVAKPLGRKGPPVVHRGIWRSVRRQMFPPGSHQKSLSLSAICVTTVCISRPTYFCLVHAYAHTKSLICVAADVLMFCTSMVHVRTFCMVCGRREVSHTHACMNR